MVTPPGESTCRETLSLADTKRTAPPLRVTPDSPAELVAEASPSVTRTMLALSRAEMS